MKFNKTSSKTFFVLTIVTSMICSVPVNADIIAYWNFNSGSAVPTTMNNTVRGDLFSADSGANVGSASMTTNGFTFSDGVTSAARGISTFTGTTLNSQLGSIALNDLALTGGDGSTGTANNSGALIFGTSTVGFDSISVSWANRVTATGFQSNQFAYSSDGGANWSNLGATFGGTTTYTLKALDLSSIIALNNNAQALFRITLAGATATSGNLRMDNLLISGNITAVPEPTSIALVSLVGCTGLVAGYRRRTSKSKMA